MRGTWSEWLVFGGLGIAWGSSYLFIKIGVETLPPLTLVAGRLAIGALLLALIIALRREALPRWGRIHGHLVVMALLSIVIPFSLITIGEQTIDSALAAILNATIPLFVLIIAPLVLDDERITMGRVAGLLIGFAGVVVLISPTIGPGFGGSLMGQVAVLGASVAYASGGVYARRNAQGVSPLVAAFLQVVIAFIISAILALIVERPLDVRLEPSAAFAVVWLGLVGSGLAFIAFFWILRRWGATRTSMVAYLLPVVGIVLGFLVLGEVVDIRVLLGAALIIGGVALVNRRPPASAPLMQGRPTTQEV